MAKLSPYLEYLETHVEGITYGIPTNFTINNEFWELSLWIRMKNSTTAERDRLLKELKKVNHSDRIGFSGTRVLLKL